MIGGFDVLTLLLGWSLGVLIGVGLALAYIMRWGCAYKDCLMCDKE